MFEGPPRWFVKYLVCALLLWTIPATTFADVTFETRALTGQTAPGTGGSFVYKNFAPVVPSGAPVINDSGDIAFYSTVGPVGTNSSNTYGIWSEFGGVQSLVALTEEETQGTTFEWLGYSLTIADSGAVGIYGTATLSDQGVGDGFWSIVDGIPNLIVMQGDPAPGVEPGTLFSGFVNVPVFNSSGSAAFVGSLIGADGTRVESNSGIWSGSGSHLRLVAREGDTVEIDGSNEVARLDSLFSLPAYNDNADTAFIGGYMSPSHGIAIWAELKGLLHLIARPNDPAPGTDNDVLFRTFGNPVINNDGDIAFNAWLTGQVRRFENDEGVWTTSGSTLRLVARSGDPAPGTEDGVVFSGQFVHIVINGSGDLAFYSNYTGPEGQFGRGLWIEKDGNLELVVRTGDQAPGTESGLVFDTFFTGGGPAFNRHGSVAFVAGLEGTRRGIWATDGDGVLKLIALEGDYFDVDNDPLIEDMRVISDVWLQVDSGGEDGQGTSYNDLGQLVFGLEFKDGSQGIFVANVPEPTSFYLLGAVGIFVSCRRRSSMSFRSLSRH